MGSVFGKLFGGTTNPGVTPPGGGPTTFYSNPAAADMALASASAKTAVPGVSSVDGNFAPDGSENEVVSNYQPPENPQPTMARPSWSDAQASAPGNPLGNKELSTKGKTLGLLLQMMHGAANAEAASLPINGGRTSVGLGPAMATGFNTPFMEQEQANTLKEQELEQSRTAAQTAAIPGQAQAELNLKNAQTQWYGAKGSVVGEKDLKPGDVLVNRNGDTIGTGASVQAAAQAKQAGKDAATSAAVQNLGGTAIQVLSALGVRNQTEKNTNVAQMYLDANNGDPGAAIKSMNADRLAHATTLHTLIASLRSTVSSDNATVKSDPQYSGLAKQRDGLLAAANHELATGELDPNSGATVARLQAQANSLTQQMGARRSQLLKTGAPAGNGSQAAQPFTHVSSDGRWGWNGSAWVATGK